MELAYEAAKQTLAHQDSTLTNIRNRVTALFTAAALAVSFTAGVGLISGDGRVGKQYPVWAGLLLFVVLVLMSAAVLIVHWPSKGWHFGPSSSVIREKCDAGWTELEVRRHVLDAMIVGCQENRPKLKFRQQAFRAVILLLSFEVLLIMVAITATW
ncbi:hypothetical protein ACFPJ1_38050 [Kribbella qitaiheensis]|uniref:hypothetical protein n=1 Tax=Kribbella qitaiheensis TaxID=1544730 RepID=UPI00360A7D3C